jgi:hypothetical protein
MKNQFSPAYAYQTGYPYAQQLWSSTYPGNSILSVGTIGPFKDSQALVGLLLAALGGTFALWATKNLGWSPLYRASAVILTSGFGFMVGKMILGIISLLRQQ